LGTQDPALTVYRQILILFDVFVDSLKKKFFYLLDITKHLLSVLYVSEILFQVCLSRYDSTENA